MDDLDRLAFRIARTVRNQYPHLLDRGFTLHDLEDRLAPFQDTRRELASGGRDSYEVSILRLLAGERGYLSSDSELKQASERALAMPSPTVALVRQWAGGTLSLKSDAMDKVIAGEECCGHDETGVDISICENDGGVNHRCHYCGSSLPHGRQITFCPCCGLNLTLRQCPACSTELELSWRFCVTCGRQSDGSDVLEDHNGFRHLM